MPDQGCSILNMNILLLGFQFRRLEENLKKNIPTGQLGSYPGYNQLGVHHS